MKRIIVTLGLLALSGFAAAQPSTVEAKPRDIDAERANISVERVRLEAGFLAEDLACHEKFAVNSCLGKVNARRRVAVAELRRQEIALNDEERRSRGEQAIRRIKEKSSPENLQQQADRRAKGAEDYQSRLEREKDKQQGRGAPASASEKAARDASSQRLLDSQKKAQARADRKSAAAEEARKFEERQKQAAERRAQHEKERLARPQPPRKTLPLPN